MAAVVPDNQAPGPRPSDSTSLALAPYCATKMAAVVPDNQVPGPSLSWAYLPWQLAILALILLYATEIDNGRMSHPWALWHGGGGTAHSPLLGPTDGPPALCTATSAMVAGSWTLPDEASPWADTYKPATCVLRETGFDADGSVCERFAAQGITRIFFIGDSLAANLELDMRVSVFGDISEGLSRYECWKGRHTHFGASYRNVCHDGTVCGGRLKVSWVDMARPHDPNLLASVKDFLQSSITAGNGAQAVAVVWFGAWYLMFPEPGMSAGHDLAELLRYFRGLAVSFPAVIVLGPPAIFPDDNGKGVDPSKVAQLSVDFHDVCLAEAQNASETKAVAVGYLDIRTPMYAGALACLRGRRNQRRKKELQGGVERFQRREKMSSRIERYDRGGNGAPLCEGSA